MDQCLQNRFSTRGISHLGYCLPHPSQGLSDTLIQLIFSHESKKSLEVYQHLSLESVDKAYQDAVQSVGI